MENRSAASSHLQEERLHTQLVEPPQQSPSSYLHLAVRTSQQQ